METIRTCNHCQFLATQADKLVCTRAEALGKLDLVLGYTPQRSAYEMRAHKGACGPEGRLWVEYLVPVIEPVSREDEPGLMARAGARVRHGVIAAAATPLIVVMNLGARWAALRERAARARAAWSGVEDNAGVLADQSEPVVLVGETVVEAVPADLLKPGSGSVELVPAEPAVLDNLQVDPQAGTRPLAMAALVLLLFWLAYGWALGLEAMPRQTYATRVGQTEPAPCCWYVPKGVKCVRCRDAQQCTACGKGNPASCGPCAVPQTRVRV